MTLQEALEVLRERKEYLAARIEAKKRVSRDWEYDAREREALSQVLETLLDEEEEEFARTV